MSRRARRPRTVSRIMSLLRDPESAARRYISACKTSHQLSPVRVGAYILVGRDHGLPSSGHRRPYGLGCSERSRLFVCELRGMDGVVRHDLRAHGYQGRCKGGDQEHCAKT